MHFRHLARCAMAFLSTLIIANCSSGDGTGTEGSIDFTLNPTSATVQQGGSTISTGTLTRSGGFTGVVNFTVTGQPSGLTATAANITTTTATFTLAVGLTTPVGVYSIVVHANGTGVTEVTKTFTLTVTAAGSFTLAVTPTGAISMAQGATDATKTITITRTNYAGSITLVAEGLPSGVTATFAGNPVSGNTSVMTLTATAGATVSGPTTVTVRGTGPASLVAPGTPANVEATTTFSLTVTAAAPVGNFSLTTTPATNLNVTQAVNGTATINIVRTGGNTSNITLSSTSTLPAGMTLAFAPSPTTTNSSVLTVITTAATPVGTTAIVIRGNTPGLGEQLVSLNIIVAAPPPVGNFTLTTTPSNSVNVTQGQNGNVTVNIVRTGGNTSSITLSSTATLPTGMTLGFAPNPTTANSSVLTITTTAATPLGTTGIVIRGNTPGLGEQTANLNIVVVAPSGSGNVNVSWAGCAAAQKPVWVAAQNGTAAWAVVTGVNDVYSFTINAGKGGLTYVLTGTGGSSQVIVQFQSQAEWTAGPVSFCNSTTPSGRTLTGTVGGMGSSDQAFASFGGVFATVFGLSPAFTLNNAGLGQRDLVIYNHPGVVVAASDRMLIDRNLDPVSSFGTRDIQTDPFSFVPLAALITVTGGVAGIETFAQSNTFYSRNSCDAAPLYFGMPVSGNQFNAYGAQTVLSTDRHGLTITGTLGNTATRSVTEYFGALTAHTVAMGSLLPSEFIVETGANYSILRNQYTAPSDLNTSYSFFYTQNAAPRTASVTASAAYFGSTAIELKIGEYTGLSGWLATWAPAKGQAASLTNSASGATGSGGFCSGLTRFIVAGRTASF